MAEIKKLKPEEFSRARKEAMEEVKPKKETNSSKYNCVCVKCKKNCFTTQKAYEARLKKYGSAEAIKEKYLCRLCRKENKA